MNPSIDSILRDRVQGDVSGVGDLGFAEAHQGFNLAAIHQPDAVVHAATAEDVSAAVRVAAEQGAQVRVQATGHGIGIPMTEGILVNTSALHEVRVDPVKRTATVGAGTQWQQVIDAAAPHGWATLCGSSPTVGVVGYTLGGGMGPMARTFGFASDRVRRLTMVDSSGNVLQIDPVIVSQSSSGRYGAANPILVSSQNLSSTLLMLLVTTAVRSFTPAHRPPPCCMSFRAGLPFSPSQ